MSHDCLIAFGSNLGDSDDCYRQINENLQSDQRFAKVLASPAVTTKPIGGSNEQSNYRNGCFRASFTGSFEELFKIIFEIEEKFGRLRRKRWDARTVDLDLLLFDDVVNDSQSLKIPHPRMTFRRFVLEPAVTIAGDMVHPVSGLTIAEHLELLDQRPDRIVIATQEPAKLAEVVGKRISQYESAGWQIQLISNAAEILSDQEQIKLLVFSRELAKDFLAKIRPFKGATLDTSFLNDVESGWSELEAAIDAMTSL